MNMFRYLFTHSLYTAHPLPWYFVTHTQTLKSSLWRTYQISLKSPKNNICTMNSRRWYHRVDGIIAFYVSAIFDVRKRIPLFRFSEASKISCSDNCLNFAFACQREKYFSDVNYETKWKYLMLSFEGKILFRDLNGINISSLFQHLHPFIFNFCRSFKFNKA